MGIWRPVGSPVRAKFAQAEPQASETRKASALFLAVYMPGAR